MYPYYNHNNNHNRPIKVLTVIRKMHRKRMHSRSNEALQPLLSTLDTHTPSTHSPPSIQHILNQNTELQDQELYKESYHKIQRIKALLVGSSGASRELMQEMNDVIDLIRGERVRAKFRIRELCRQGEQGEQGEGEGGRVVDVGVNTDDILQGEMTETLDIGIQTQPDSPPPPPPLPQNDKKHECYYKIVCMIDKLKVDYRQILPILLNLPPKYPLPDVQANKAQYRSLKKQEILKLQKVFISKLHTMVNGNGNGNGNGEVSRKGSERVDRAETPKKERDGEKGEMGTAQSNKAGDS